MNVCVSTDIYLGLTLGNNQRNHTEAESNILIFFLRARQSPHGMRYGVGNGSLEGERGGGDGYREEG